MKVEICESKQAMGEMAAQEGARLIREALLHRGEANIVVASGTSQLELLRNLVAAEGIAWHDVTGFHLDEYVGCPSPTRPPSGSTCGSGSSKNLPLPLRGFHYIEADRDPERRAPAPGRAPRAAPDRRRVHRHRGKRAHRLQRASRGLPDRGALPHRRAHRGLAATAGRRGVVSRPSTRCPGAPSRCP